MKKLTARQWGKVRKSLYGIGSATLKYLGVAGIVNDNESQILLLILSGLMDLAFVKVDLPDDEEELSDEA